MEDWTIGEDYLRRRYKENHEVSPRHRRHLRYHKRRGNSFCRVDFRFLLTAVDFDTQVGAPLTTSEMHQMLKPFAKDILYGGIDLSLSHSKFAEENDRHASLFMVNTTSPSIIEPDYANTLRFCNDQCGLYDIPVVAVDLQYNQKPTEVPAGSLILCSLARGWEGSRPKPFPVKRCYLVVDGIITPPGSALM